MDDEGVIFANGRKVMAYYPKADDLIEIFEHPKDVAIYALKNTEKGLLIGSETGIRNFNTGEDLAMGGIVTSIFEYDGRMMAFSGYGDGVIVDIETGKIQLVVNNDNVGKRLRGGPGTLVESVGERSFLANECVYEIVQQQFVQKTDWLEDRPRIFSYDDGLFISHYQDVGTHPCGRTLVDLDGKVIASFPFIEQQRESTASINASENGNCWIVLIDFDKNDIGLYVLPSLMKGENQEISERPEQVGSTELHRNENYISNPLDVTSAINVEKLVAIAYERTIDKFPDTIKTAHAIRGPL